MNKRDRQQLAEALTLLETAHGILSQLAEAERGKFDNMSEGLQASERGQAIENAATELESAAGDTQNAIDSLGNIE